MKQTAVARYLAVSAKHQNRRPNKRLRKAARLEVDQLVRSIDERDRAVVEGVKEADAKMREQHADRLYGAEKYGRDTQQSLVIPLYTGKPPDEPEMGFCLIAVAGKRRHLWHDGAWVELSGALMREPSSSGLRVALAQACRFQEARAWAGERHALRFRDQTIDVKHMIRHLTEVDHDWGHSVPKIGGWK